MGEVGLELQGKNSPDGESFALAKSNFPLFFARAFGLKLITFLWRVGSAVIGADFFGLDDCGLQSE